MKIKEGIIREARLKRKHTQEEMAHFLDISQSQYSRLENDEIPFELDKLGRLIDILDLNLLEILEFSEKQQVYINSYNTIGTNNGSINSPLVTNDIELIRKIVQEELNKR